MERTRKIVPVAVAVILDKDMEHVLLQRRDHNTGVEGLDGMWELPGGKIEFGETPEETVQREIAEELKVIVKIMRHYPVCLRTNIWRHPDFDMHVLLIPYWCQIMDTAGLGSWVFEKARWFRVTGINYSTTLPGTREMIEAVFK